MVDNNQLRLITLKKFSDNDNFKYTKFELLHFNLHNK